MNGDIMMLMTKPKKGRLEPLKQYASLASSSESSLDSYQMPFGTKKNYNYPPDLRTAQQMIKEGKKLGASSPRQGAIQVTDFSR